MSKGIALGTGCVFALIASLALARLHPSGDAGLFEHSVDRAQLLSNVQMPPEVRTLLVTKCADCHSSQTQAPFYGHFAPASWLIESDIVRARQAMNLSAWESYPVDRRQTLAAKMVQEIKEHDMPPFQYRAIHWNATLTDADATAIAAWAHSLQVAQASGAGSGQGEPNRGQAVFERRCSGCHSLDRNRQGPLLRGVYGRTSGTAPGYAYSDALKKAGLVWNDRSLDKWLADPDQFVSGNNMDFLVSGAQDRADLIAFLRQLNQR